MNAPSLAGRTGSTDCPDLEDGTGSIPMSSPSNSTLGVITTHTTSTLDKDNPPSVSLSPAGRGAAGPAVVPTLRPPGAAAGVAECLTNNRDLSE